MLTIVRLRSAKWGIPVVLFVIGILSLPLLSAEKPKDRATGARPLPYCSCQESVYFECTRKQFAPVPRWA